MMFFRLVSGFRDSTFPGQEWPKITLGAFEITPSRPKRLLRGPQEDCSHESSRTNWKGMKLSSNTTRHKHSDTYSPKGLIIPQMICFSPL